MTEEYVCMCVIFGSHTKLSSFSIMPFFIVLLYTYLLDSSVCAIWFWHSRFVCSSLFFFIDNVLCWFFFFFEKRNWSVDFGFCWFLIALCAYPWLDRKNFDKSERTLQTCSLPLSLLFLFSAICLFWAKPRTYRIDIRIHIARVYF